VGEKPLQFEIANNQRLRQLDTEGQPIVSDLPYELTSQGALEPLDDHLFIGGMFVYMADAARLIECRTGRSYPVAMEGDYGRLEKAYLEARQNPAQPLMVTFEGSIEERPRVEGRGTEATAVVKRFINVWPGETCERNRADASLTNTYWRIVKLGDQEIRVGDGRREPHILLRTNEARFSATVGCNHLVGGYETTGETLRFSPAASTMMACPPPLDQLEHRLVETLANTRTSHIAGQVLELRDGEGRSVALFQAVYLR
jgi:heat shock protein HslJ